MTLWKNAYVRKLIKSFYTNWTGDLAGKHGGLFVLCEWGKELPYYTNYAMDCAAWKGHLQVVQWLHANRAEGCTWRAMNWAAGCGLLEIVQWLHRNRTEGCSTMAIDMAAERGHLEVIQWLHANRTEGCTENAILLADYYGHFATAQWLRNHPEIFYISQAGPTHWT